MAGTLLDLVARRFGVPVDPDSNGGRVLVCLTPPSGLDESATSGRADGALTFTATSEGVVPAVAGADLLVFDLPGPFDFRLVAATPEQPTPTVELRLVAPTLPLPFLRPAVRAADGLLEAGSGGVTLHLPDLLLVVTAGVTPPSTARLAPSHDSGDALAARIEPPLTLLGPGTTVGLEFAPLGLRLAGVGGPELTVPSVQLHVAPPGIPGLALHGGGSGLRLGLAAGDGGLTGDLSIATADDAQAPLRPEVVRSIAAHVRLDRSAVTLLELTGEVDLAGEVERRLGATLPEAGGPLAYRLRLTLDDGWGASLTLGADDGPFLWRTRRPDPSGQDLVGNALGAYAVLGPLLASTLPEVGDDGVADLALAAGSAAALGTTGLIVTHALTLIGAELSIRTPPGGRPRAVLLLDLETEVDLRIGLGGASLVRTRRPLKVRQRSLGLRLDLQGAAPSLRPVFDPANGLSLDLSDPGTFEVPGPLGELLQGDGARTARDNPLTLEVDLLPKANLGIATLDRATIRAPIVPPGLPTLTGLRAHLDAGAVKGSGYLDVDEDGIAGGLDASLAAPLGVRAQADLRLGQARDHVTGADVTSVLAAFAVEWPVPVPLANSGLGLFGVLGLLGVNIERDQVAGGPLAWLVDAPGGDPAQGAWHGSAGGWALGLGAVIGTVEGGFLLHAKGMLMIELPGPRLLLVMRADLLGPPPPTGGADDLGTLLALIEIRPEAITIGVVVERRIPFLLDVRVPAEARFDLVHPERWSLDVGAIPEAVPPRLPASVRFMSSLRAEGYLLLHGDGIPDFPLRPLHGFAVAAGVRAALTWGPEEIGLYIRVAARADVGIGFKPFTVIGKVTLEGELHLFVVSIGASASARLVIDDRSFFVEAEICGEVDVFFFSVEGCVTFRLGDERVGLPAADPLVRALSLHSRSPALLPGSGAAGAVDGSLGTAGAPGTGDLPVVPIDAIPVLELDMRPHVDGATFLGTPIPSLLPGASWVRRGERFYRYTLRGVELNGGAGGPVDGDDRPVVWWDRHGTPAPGDDTAVQLALLSWIPDPTPAAAERTLTRDREVRRRFGDVCAEVARPAAVLWSFAGVTAGPSASGWTLRGTVWPDAGGVVRSQPVEDRLGVAEPWRTGHAQADALVDVLPAAVFAGGEPGRQLLTAPHVGAPPRPRIEGDDAFDAIIRSLPRLRGETLADALRLRLDGLHRLRALVFLHEVGSLVLRGLDDAGEPTGFDAVVDGGLSHVVNGMDDLPEEWRDVDRPWLPVVEAVVDGWFREFQEALGGQLLLLELELPEGTAAVELGLDGDADDPRPHWGVLLVEALSRRELARVAFDEERQRTRVAVVDGALGADPANRALLRPDTTYEVKVTYDVATASPDEAGNPVPDGVPTAGRTQSFAFRTDAAPPAWLDPWVLTTSPADGETAFFHDEPVRIVFATGATRRLYRSYGKELFAVVRAASGRHPVGGAGFDPNDVRLDLAVRPAATVGPFVVTPFAGALHDVAAGLACVTRENRQSAHELVTLQLRLEPRTQYVLDLEARPGAPALRPLLRRAFTTSRYPGAEALAADVAARPLAHRALGPGASLALLDAAGTVMGDVELERALRAARWGELRPPDVPRVTAIWQGAQPVALLVETTEPHWRTRAVPRLDDPPADPQEVRRYRLVEEPWLELVEASAAVVRRLVRTTGGARTVALLRPGARGAVVELVLRRSPHPLFEGAGAPTQVRMLRADLSRPPWER